MIFQLRYHESFVEDFATAANWYGFISYALKLQYVRNIRKAVKKLETHPQAFKKFGATSFRRIKVPKFPYHIYYSIDATEVWVMALIHDRRSNRYISRRLRH
jgi:plasmid stabilization system protein ParE